MSEMAKSSHSNIKELPVLPEKMGRNKSAQLAIEKCYI